MFVRIMKELRLSIRALSLVGKKFQISHRRGAETLSKEFFINKFDSVTSVPLRERISDIRRSNRTVFSESDEN